jgi:hypothetical protein
VQRQLLGQRVTQLGIVVDDKNPTRVWHQSRPPRPLARRSMTRPPIALPAILLRRLARSRTT